MQREREKGKGEGVGEIERGAPKRELNLIIRLEKHQNSGALFFALLYLSKPGGDEIK